MPALPHSYSVDPDPEPEWGLERALEERREVGEDEEAGGKEEEDKYDGGGPKGGKMKGMPWRARVR